MCDEVECVMVKAGCASGSEACKASLMLRSCCDGDAGGVAEAEWYGLEPQDIASGSGIVLHRLLEC